MNVGGALIFWVIAFACGGVSMLWAFFVGLAYGINESSAVVMAFFAPFIAGVLITDVVLIALQKRLAVIFAYIAIGLSALYAIVQSAVIFANSTSVRSSYDYYYSAGNSDSQALILMLGTIVVSLVVAGLTALYFVVSTRVKQTLVK